MILPYLWMADWSFHNPVSAGHAWAWQPLKDDKGDIASDFFRTMRPDDEAGMLRPSQLDHIKVRNATVKDAEDPRGFVAEVAAADIWQEMLDDAEELRAEFGDVEEELQNRLRILNGLGRTHCELDQDELAAIRRRISQGRAELDFQLECLASGATERLAERVVDVCRSYEGNSPETNSRASDA